MSFDIKINKQELNKFKSIILGLYPDFNFAQIDETEDTLTFKVLGEDMEKDTLLQETIMEHLDSINIEENI